MCPSESGGVPVPAVVGRLGFEYEKAAFRHFLAKVDDHGFGARGGHLLADVVDVFFIRLGQIGGVGRKKLEAYGERFLRCIVAN